ncbi:bifunctional UDP-sugar hydrolase/5'-nucleotidase UshA [Erwinia tracheiphila]|uniref:5'-nucleotidase n=1 Tax=Erwinia tracheiphila TaxID=65700 RepID=A0A0M2KAC0_9GAMM|nr:bifunctional UDP-sugar hydrolase/5'-nucleotidase UshA [Erwinia tracheiphila]AXF74952.1 bifunctional UDP-sugar hydrolase/5'-nucleotidase [Erwinia tracheiphila]EOS94300.1 bifunctional UDP-sugar hydrolase/5'-nucleotidase periplasmic precursor [Erwinia tracheiphila PSU-1]KKF34222.1 5'-nucleotidase [Erwinia tracheiphila]UIA85761.1 bifunctional UDP-sugar hydrolase/5'-nucleotidase UshA [Erwinia tracheiphila]UIA90035.1 bifunctional UDP-sugar hydrolase/5'-nucleotidase UshA [Erwinia tracheiphila]
MSFLKKNVLPTLALTIFITPLAAQAWVKDKVYKFTVLHTNDHHGRFWQNEHDEYGLAAQKTMMDQIRYDVQAHGGAVLILSGGDINTGVPESDLQDAEPDFRGMNLVGYDAMAIGNHEFDNPLSVLRQQQKWAKFPLLSANIYQKSIGKRLFQPYALFNRMGLKIAVIGLTTDDTAKIGNPEYFTDMEFRKPATEAKEVVEQLRKKEKPDVVIAVTHMGHYDNGNHGSNAPGDVEMARELPAGYLNMIVGGHSQNPVCMAKENVKQADYVPGTPCKPDRQNGTWIVQAHEWGKYIGRADFTFVNGNLTLEHYELVPINLRHKVKNADGSTSLVNYTQEIAKNPGMLKLLTPFQKKGEAQLGISIGSVKGELEGDRSKVRFRQTNLARMMLMAQIERTGADFAVMSGGGVRDSIASGKITYKDVLKVQPFGNTLTYVDMTGSEVEKYLAVVANITVDSGGYAQFANVSLRADGKGVSEVKIKGDPIQSDKTYRMATLSFNATGGDGYPAVNLLPGYVNTGFVDAEVLKQYIQKHSPLDAAGYAPEGEIVYN